MKMIDIILKKSKHHNKLSMVNNKLRSLFYTTIIFNDIIKIFQKKIKDAEEKKKKRWSQFEEKTLYPK